MLSFKVLQIFFCLALIKSRQKNAKRAADFDTIYEQRLAYLEKFATTTNSVSPSNDCCGCSGHLILRQEMGRMNNHFVQVVHGLWLANKMNRTLVLPQSMTESFRYFELGKVKSAFCFAFENELNLVGKALVSTQRFFVYGVLQRGHSFFIDEVAFDQHQVEHFLRVKVPPLDKDGEIIAQVSKWYVRFLSMLWSQPNEKLKRDTIDFVQKYLGGQANYVSVHKRQFEGGCSKVLFAATSPSDFATGDLPARTSTLDNEWDSSLAHPLCTMTSAFIKNIMALRGLKRHRVFLSHDGQAPIDDLRLDLGAVTTDTISPTTDRSFLDMMVAMHGDLFVLNPRSTFSWTVFVVRTALGLESAPLLSNRNMYLRDPTEVTGSGRHCNDPEPGGPQESLRGEAKLHVDGANACPWVNWTSITEAVHVLRHVHQE